jgi:hypothetical protein
VHTHLVPVPAGAMKARSVKLRPASKSRMVQLGSVPSSGGRGSRSRCPASEEAGEGIDGLLNMMAGDVAEHTAGQYPSAGANPAYESVTPVSAVRTSTAGRARSATVVRAVRQPRVEFH